MSVIRRTSDSSVRLLDVMLSVQCETDRLPVRESENVGTYQIEVSSLGS
jgi:hypothetical protein